MSGIFISYRRQDTSGYAGRLYERLSKHFGKRHVFMDIDTLQPGLDFGEALDQAVSSCEVLIALIGPTWLGAVDADGQRRLDNPDDFVRMEIAAALARDGVRVVPVLVGGASLPKADALPGELKPLARRQSVEISDHRWDYDVARLIERLESVVPRARSGVVTSRRAVTALVPLLLLLIALVLRFGLLDGGGEAGSVSTPTVTATVQSAPAGISTPHPTGTPESEFSGSAEVEPTVTGTPNPATPQPAVIGTPLQSETPLVAATSALATPAGTPVPSSTPIPEATPATPATSEPLVVATIPPAVQAAGLVSEYRYVSPQHGHTVEWDDTWMLDLDYEPPVMSDEEERFDAVHITTAELYTPFLRVAAYDAAGWTSIEEVVGHFSSDAWLETAYPGAEKRVLLQKYSGDSGGMVVSRTTDSGTEYIAIFEAHLVNGGETVLLVTMTSTPNQIAGAHARTSETVRLNDRSPLRVFSVDEIVVSAEAMGEGRISLYESSRFDYTLSWDSRWVPNPEMEPAIGYTEETSSEFIHLRPSDQGRALLMVGVVGTRGLLDVEAVVTSYSSDDFLTTTFGEDYIVLTKDIQEDAGGIVLVYGTADGRFVTIMESVLLEESAAMVTLIYTAPIEEADQVVTYIETVRAESLWLNGEPLPEGIDGDVISELFSQPGSTAPRSAPLEGPQDDVLPVSGWSERPMDDTGGEEPVYGTADPPRRVTNPSNQRASPGQGVMLGPISHMDQA